ncbi:TlpA family protein disulfide reductase [Salinibacter grassmerensis]|uniref:TlpA family protein disulfide reductase n=1 Tax=Salinibacter grassmerensis TaxID=3040353 RepID=UPI0021E81A4E|nr:TlpA disulfide reductase family protein [Salinibacter grassmerensis]
MPERGPFDGRTALNDYGEVPGGWTLRPVSETASSEASGESIRFEKLQDGPVVVNKWATWCPPCVEEIGSLQSLHGRSREETSVVLVSEEDVETVRRFAEKRGVSVPMYVTDEMPAALEGKTIPRTHVVKADREVVYCHVGAADWSTDRVYRFLGRLGASPVEDASSTD